MVEGMEYWASRAVYYVAWGFVLFLTLGGALVAVVPRSIVKNVFGLALSLGGVAGFYVFLNSGFLAAMQLLIYIGAICVAIAFAIMLAEPVPALLPPRSKPKVAMAIGGALVVVIILAAALSQSEFKPAAEQVADWSVKRLGLLLFTNYELMFELVSLVLLIAILGAIITAAVFVNGKKPAEGGQGGSR